MAAVLPELLDIRVVAQHLGVTVRHVRRLVAERRIPFIKWGHLIRFDPNDIEPWIDNARRDARTDLQVQAHPSPGPTRPAWPHRPARRS
jgi:excisionase family DNA binding protein